MRQSLRTASIKTPKVLWAFRSLLASSSSNTDKSPKPCESRQRTSPPQSSQVCREASERFPGLPHWRAVAKSFHFLLEVRLHATSTTRAHGRPVIVVLSKASTPAGHLRRAQALKPPPPPPQASQKHARRPPSGLWQQKPPKLPKTPN